MPKMAVLTLLFLSLALAGCYKPIIAIYGNSEPETDFDLNAKDSVTGTYPRWIQESGGEVMVIHPWHSDEEVDEILSKVNGVLFQGGGREFKLTSRWETSAARIIKKAIEYNLAKEIFPIWGTCQGFQLILTLMANELILEGYEDWIRLHKTIFNDKTRKASIHSFFKEKDFNLLENSDSTIYYHHFGVSQPVFNKFNELVTNLDITSLGVDDNKKEFINSFEGKEGLPLYGVQYHPEKNPYNRQEAYVLPHNTDARKISQLLSLFFLSKARESTHRMDVAERKKYDFITSYSKGNYDTFNDNTYIFSKKN